MHNLPPRITMSPPPFSLWGLVVIYITVTALNIRDFKFTFPGETSGVTPQLPGQNQLPPDTPTLTFIGPWCGRPGRPNSRACVGAARCLTSRPWIGRDIAGGTDCPSGAKVGLAACVGEMVRWIVVKLVSRASLLACCCCGEITDVVIAPSFVVVSVVVNATAIVWRWGQVAAVSLSADGWELVWRTSAPRYLMGWMSCLATAGLMLVTSAGI